MNLQRFFLQPFSLIFNRYDIHVMLYLKDHPEYEAVEAMIQESNDNPLIRVILTKHDQIQIDYTNDRNLFARIISEKIKRETYFTEINYIKRVEEGKPFINLQFRTVKGEDVDFNFYSAFEPSARYSGLINPQRHAEKTSLPIMYRDRSTLAGPQSSISFAGCSYKIPKKVWIPFVFIGMKGYYSEVFSIGVFRTLSEKYSIVTLPRKFSIGERWVYQSDSVEKIYGIIDQKDNSLIVQHGNQKIIIEDAELLSIKEILIPATTGKGDQGYFAIKFSPALPIISEREIKKVDFTISINQHEKLVSGKVQVFTENNASKFYLAPDKPQWAVKRPISVTLEKVDSQVLINTKVDLP